MDRYCPTGNHFKRASLFRTMSNGRPARDCLECEQARKRRGLTEVSAFPGVDIDRIHFKLGAVKRPRKAA